MPAPDNFLPGLGWLSNPFSDRSGQIDQQALGFCDVMTVKRFVKWQGSIERVSQHLLVVHWVRLKIEAKICFCVSSHVFVRQVDQVTNVIHSRGHL